MRANISRADWEAELTRFTERNAGRRTSLEVHDPEIGVREQERDYQLQGLAFDHRDNRIEIMLGGFEGAGPHLTHTIGNVDSLDLVTDAEGSDTALQIEHNGVRTLLYIRRDA
jgi:hypothetical protein